MSSSLPSLLLMRPASSSCWASFGELLEAAGGIVAEQVAGPVDVDLGERAR